ncbi:DUF7289 family protein [Natronomonas sp. EA1]|uniref:DUF7289 family protein n=1 Tax=Natronomonas sp. EA1 TaxID=3421655 RepID=UPI003EBD20CF
MTDERAVSDVISFALVFALIATTAAVVSVVGIGGLEDTRNAEQANNAERAFEVFADNVQDIHSDGAPSRSTEIKLAGATLAYGNTTTIEISHDDGDAPYRAELKPLVYETGETKIVYEGGAVFRVDDGNAVMLGRPPFRLTSGGQSLFTLVETRALEAGSISGETTVLVRATHQQTTVPFPDGPSADPGSAVTLTISTSAARAPVWADALNEEWGSTVCTANGGLVSCTFPEAQVTELFVRTTTITLQFD